MKKSTLNKTGKRGVNEIKKKLLSTLFWHTSTHSLAINFFHTLIVVVRNKFDI